MKRTLTILIAMMIVFISGCTSNKQQKVINEMNPKPFVILIQAAVDGYLSDTGVLPIQNSELDTPLYEKYKIDFKRLKGQGYIANMPENAFENGGSNYYVLFDVEAEPVVKLLNIPTLRKAMEVEQLIKAYMNKNSYSIPSKENVSSEWYTIDYDKLKIEEVQVKSLYSNQYLGLLVHRTGTVVIDYASEIMQLVMREQLTDIDEALDLRHLLIDHYYYVPAQSNAYYWNNNEPVLSPQIEK